MEIKERERNNTVFLSIPVKNYSRTPTEKSQFNFLHFSPGLILTVPIIGKTRDGTDAGMRGEGKKNGGTKNLFKRGEELDSLGGSFDCLPRFFF